MTTTATAANTATINNNLDVLQTLHLIKWSTRCSGVCAQCLIHKSANTAKCLGVVAEAK